MPAPITWRQVTAPNFGSSNRLFESASNSILQSGQNLSNRFSGLERDLNADQNKFKKQNDDELLRQINAISSIEDLEKAKASGQFDADTLNKAIGENNYNGLAVQGALDKRLSSLRSGAVAEDKFNQFETAKNFEDTRKQFNNIIQNGTAAEKAALQESDEYKNFIAKGTESNVNSLVGQLNSSIRRDEQDVLAAQDRSFALESRNRTRQNQANQDTVNSILQNALAPVPEGIADPASVHDRARQVFNAVNKQTGRADLASQASRDFLNANEAPDKLTSTEQVKRSQEVAAASARQDVKIKQLEQEIAKDTENFGSVDDLYDFAANKTRETVFFDEGGQDLVNNIIEPTLQNGITLSVGGQSLNISPTPKQIKMALQTSLNDIDEGRGEINKGDFNRNLEKIVRREFSQNSGKDLTTNKRKSLESKKQRLIDLQRARATGQLQASINSTNGILAN